MKLSKLFLSHLLLAICLAACAAHAYQSTNREHQKKVKTFAKQLRQYPPQGSLSTADYWVGTTNFGMRKPNFVIIHHTAQNNCDQTLRTFTIPRTQVSAHYVICKDGTVHQMLNDYLRAHHAGIGSWGYDTDLNSSSIGIELDNNGFEYFDDRQIKSLLTVLDTLKKRYAIPSGNFIGHGDIAPTRKNDPNWRFPWKELADRGFGKWYSDTTGIQVPEHFDKQLALRVLGYNITDSVATRQSFKRHWLRDTTVGWTPAAEKILFLLTR